MRIGRWSAFGVMVALAALAAACTYTDEPGSTRPARSTPSSSVPSTTDTETDDESALLGCAGVDDRGAPLPAGAAAAIDEALALPQWDAVEHSISIWVEGHGEVVAANPDLALVPASNQKLFTAIGTHVFLGADERFVTEVRAVGDSVTLVAGGDPTLRSRGAHSLAALAAQVRRAGIASVTSLGADASHFEYVTALRGWQDWHIPTYVGPQSAFMVDDNRHRRDEDYLSNPVLGNLELFRSLLASEAVGTAGVVLDPTAVPEGDVVASLSSVPVAQLRADMLRRSDNEHAEALLRAVGRGSTSAGVARIDEVLRGWCAGVTGESGDGSGLSRANRRSAREWRMLLQVAAVQPWGDELRSALPVAGRTGTLAGRLGPVAGAVQAKTGSIIGGRALAGYATTAAGREVVFSIVVNGEPAAAAAARTAIDALVVAVVTG